MAKTKFVVAAAYDTETTTIHRGDDTFAFPVLYILNDLRHNRVQRYDSKRDVVRFFRTAEEMVDAINELVEWGLEEGVTPIICAYNLMFDMRSLMPLLARRYEMTCTAQSSTNVYTLDLYHGLYLSDNPKPLLRFWDTFFLERRGLKAMGETCGLKKATGDWDYSLIRTPNTPLTEQELFYAKRDVQVIPQYLRFILETNADSIGPTDLGVTALTSTSLVRQMAAHEIGNIHSSDKSRNTLLKSFESLCDQEEARTFEQYALRHACFRGGWTLTAARFAGKPVRNVCSMDVTSMHHTYINGRLIPERFRPVSQQRLQRICDRIVRTPMSEVLGCYHMPFNSAIHARVAFRNIRLKGCFARWGIALIPQAKFMTKVEKGTDYGRSETDQVAITDWLQAGYVDQARNATFALGKLMRADECMLHLTELELWTIAQVYDFDAMEAVEGEATCEFCRPPDYVTLQSNMLFERKSAAKFISKHYVAGEPYAYDIPDSVPAGIADMLRRGTASSKFVDAWYNSTVKGQFNGIYGTQAQNLHRPDYIVTEDGRLMIDPATRVSEESFEKAEKSRVLYTYGMRIAGGSRMHLAIAMMLLADHFGERIDVTGGDTDSLKVRLDDDVTNEELLETLKPLHDACDRAIAYTMRRVRRCYPEKASQLTDVGHFDIEGCGRSDRYVSHMEAWNKARISLDTDGHAHITCAGLSRPDGAFTIEDAIDKLTGGDVDHFERVAPFVLGYNVLVDHSLSFALEDSVPEFGSRFQGEVTDYLGRTEWVDAPQVSSLYPVGRMLGETDKMTNLLTIRFLREEYGEDVDDGLRGISYDKESDTVKLWRMGEYGDVVEVTI